MKNINELESIDKPREKQKKNYSSKKVKSCPILPKI